MGYCDTKKLATRSMCNYFEPAHIGMMYWFPPSCGKLYIFCGLPMFTLQTEGRNSSLLITPRSVFHFNISLPIYTAYMCQDMSSISNWKQISLYRYYSLHAHPVQINLCLQALRTTTHLYGIAPSFQKDMQPKNTTSSTDAIFQHIRNSNTSEISTTPYDRLLP